MHSFNEDCRLLRKLFTKSGPIMTFQPHVFLLESNIYGSRTVLSNTIIKTPDEATLEEWH